jgi:hypothetical protein
VVSGCREHVVAELTENKTKPSGWGLAVLCNKLSQVGVVATIRYKVGGWRLYVVAELTDNKTKPSSWGLSELGPAVPTFCPHTYFI